MDAIRVIQNVLVQKWNVKLIAFTLTIINIFQ
jgi:hypothetical protein